MTNIQKRLQHLIFDWVKHLKIKPFYPFSYFRISLCFSEKQVTFIIVTMYELVSCFSLIMPRTYTNHEMTDMLLELNVFKEINILIVKWLMPQLS